jgi:hypothetical protein
MCLDVDSQSSVASDETMETPFGSEGEEADDGINIYDGDENEQERDLDLEVALAAISPEFVFIEDPNTMISEGDLQMIHFRQRHDTLILAVTIHVNVTIMALLGKCAATAEYGDMYFALMGDDEGLVQEEREEDEVVEGGRILDAGSIFRSVSQSFSISSTALRLRECSVLTWQRFKEIWTATKRIMKSSRIPRSSREALEEFARLFPRRVLEPVLRSFVSHTYPYSDVNQSDESGSFHTFEADLVKQYLHNYEDCLERGGLDHKDFDRLAMFADLDDLENELDDDVKWFPADARGVARDLIHWTLMVKRSMVDFQNETVRAREIRECFERDEEEREHDKLRDTVAWLADQFPYLNMVE